MVKFFQNDEASFLLSIKQKTFLPVENTKDKTLSSTVQALKPNEDFAKVVFGLSPGGPPCKSTLKDIVTNVDIRHLYKFSGLNPKDRKPYNAWLHDQADRIFDCWKAWCRRLNRPKHVKAAKTEEEIMASLNWPGQEDIWYS